MGNTVQTKLKRLTETLEVVKDLMLDNGLKHLYKLLTKLAEFAGDNKRTAVHIIDNCQQCRYLTIDRTAGAGYAINWICEHPDVVPIPNPAETTNKNSNVSYQNPSRIISGYIEWSRDEPKQIPIWCPLLVFAGV